MGCGTPKTVFSSSDLDGLELVFDEVCAGVKDQRGHISERTKAAIRKRLFLLACNGLNDPVALRDRLVISFTRTKHSRLFSRSSSLQD